MGLFSKKPKASPPEAPPAPPPPSGSPFPPLEAPPQQQPVQQDPPPRPSKPSKKKFSVDPVDFLALRSEMMDLRARLDASEQSRAIVETRLAALDATTTAIASERPALGGDDVQARLAELQSQLASVAETATAAAANAETASAQAAAAATVAGNATAATGPLAPTGADPELLARIESLAAEVATAKADAAQAAEAAHAAQTAQAAQSAQPATEVNVVDPGLVARLDQLSARLDDAPDLERIAGLEAQVQELVAKVSAPVEASPSGPDPDTLERLDQLAERVTAIDAFGAQLSQLNARVTAQAEFGAQLGSLRDRITELSNETEDRRAAAVAATGDADLRDRVNAIADRLATTDGLAAQIAQLAERVAATDSTTRQAAEQVAAVEQRLNAVGTELANQVSELGRDIDGLAAQRNDVEQGNISDEVIEHLKNAQVKLAFEQARYEIAFRQDLAALAEQVRRPRA